MLSPIVLKNSNTLWKDILYLSSELCKATEKENWVKVNLLHESRDKLLFKYLKSTIDEKDASIIADNIKLLLALDKKLMEKIKKNIENTSCEINKIKHNNKAIGSYKKEYYR